MGEKKELFTGSEAVRDFKKGMVPPFPEGGEWLLDHCCLQLTPHHVVLNTQSAQVHSSWQQHEACLTMSPENHVFLNLFSLVKKDEVQE